MRAGVRCSPRLIDQFFAGVVPSRCRSVQTSSFLGCWFRVTTKTPARLIFPFSNPCYLIYRWCRVQTSSVCVRHYTLYRKKGRQYRPLRHLVRTRQSRLLPKHHGGLAALAGRCTSTCAGTWSEMDHFGHAVCQFATAGRLAPRHPDRRSTGRACAGRGAAPVPCAGNPGPSGAVPHDPASSAPRRDAYDLSGVP